MTTATHTAHVIALSELHDTASPSSPAAIPRGRHPLHRVKAQLDVCVGRMELTIGELMSAKEHSVYPLDRRVDEPVDLILEGQVVARGELVAMGDNFAIRITELPLPLPLEP